MPEDKYIGEITCECPNCGSECQASEFAYTIIGYCEHCATNFDINQCEEIIKGQEAILKEDAI